MKTILHLVVVAACMFPLVAQAHRKPEFDDSRLSEAGRQAYQKLFGARVFRIGKVYGSQISAEERALAVLLQEKEAVEALRSLISDASPEGGLYGLLGLRLKGVGAFEEEAIHYLSREGPPERALPPLKREDVVVPKGYVVTQNESGHEIRPKRYVVEAIGGGRYDEVFRKDGGS